MNRYRISVSSDGMGPVIEVVANLVGNSMWGMQLWIDGDLKPLPQVGPFSAEEVARLCTFTLAESSR